MSRRPRRPAPVAGFLPRRQGRWLLATAVCWLAIGHLGSAQDAAPAAEKPSRRDASSPRAEHAAAEQADFGMVFKAQGGGFRNLAGTITVPADWPNQQRVRVVKEDLPPGAAVSYASIDDVGRQMTVKIPFLPAGKEVRAVVTFAVETLTPPPLPQDTAEYTAAARHDLGRKLAVHLAPSPKIESDDAQVRHAMAEAVGDRSGAWEKVEAIHRWVHKTITFAGDMENVQSCMTTLKTRRGVCAEMNSLNVAMLRAAGFPARLVRIPGHCYYEVYLVDGQGTGHWLCGDASKDATIRPSQAAEGMILQKGDNVNIVDPKTKRWKKGRFLADTASGMPQSRAAQLDFQPISPALKVSPRTPVSSHEK